MSSSQAQAQALNAKMESEARKVIEDIERTSMRNLERKGLECALQCYQKAGSTAASEVLQQCVQNCQMPARQAAQVLNQEVNGFQNRLNRSMMECQDKAKDQMTPGMESDPKKMAALEDTMLKCMSQTVDHHIGLLKPMRQRIEAVLGEAAAAGGGESGEKKKGWW